jgi:hypothetical protein
VSSFPIKKVLQTLQDEWLITAVRGKPRRDAGDRHCFRRWQVAAAYAIGCCLEVKANGGGPKLGVNVVQEYRRSSDKTTDLVNQLKQ